MRLSCNSNSDNGLGANIFHPGAAVMMAEPVGRVQRDMVERRLDCTNEGNESVVVDRPIRPRSHFASHGGVTEDKSSVKDRDVVMT